MQLKREYRYHISVTYKKGKIMKITTFMQRLMIFSLFLGISFSAYVGYREYSINCSHVIQDHHTHHLVCIIDDSIENSVFEGQIIQPLLQYQQQDPDTAIHIISFERHALDTSKLAKIIPAQFSYTVCARYPLMGLVSLWPATYRAKCVLDTLDSYSILARGPIASYIALQALDDKKCKKLTVQARSLFADEYAFCNVDRSSGVMKLLHQWRLAQYHKVERAGYAPEDVKVPFEVEAVTTALKDYLVAQYQAKEEYFTIAQQDIPPSIPVEQRREWRKEVREELHIPLDAHVYCYNGSVQLWQDAKSTVAMFVEECKKHPGAYFVAITQNINEFKEALQEYGIEDTRYRLFGVKHADVSRYLCACDTGLMYRVDHIISWVARPVKVLEYQAAGLEVVHNNTVAWVKEVLA